MFILFYFKIIINVYFKVLQKYNFYLYDCNLFKNFYCVKLNLIVTPANVLLVLNEFAMNGSVIS